MTDSSQSTKSQKLKQATKLLKLVVTLDDLEIIKSTIESVIEILDEENDNPYWE